MYLAYSLNNHPPNWLKISQLVSPKLAYLLGILFCGWPPARLLGILTLMFWWHGYECGLQVLGWYLWTQILPFPPKIHLNLVPDWAIWLEKVKHCLQGFYTGRLHWREQIAPLPPCIHSMTMKKHFDASKQLDTTACSILIAKSPPILVSDWPCSQPKIGIFGRDFVPWLASCKVIGDPGPHVSMTWVWRRATGLGTVPVSPHHAFRAKNPPQFGTRLGYLPAQSKALFGKDFTLCGCTGGSG